MQQKVNTHVQNYYIKIQREYSITLHIQCWNILGVLY